ncbi:MAG: DUF2878 domain-containing protein [Bdellovibrionales bacterium]|nr:DUF2878 domain-containing protein [Bdellovibrionales bacterium]
MERSAAFKIWNAIIFQLSWWLIAYWQNKAVLIVLFFITLHFFLISIENLKQELKIVFYSAGIGVFFDTLLNTLQIIKFGNENTFFLPFWMIVLWLAFSITLNNSLKWVFKSKIFAFSLGACGGSLSYWAAYKLNTINIALPIWQVLSLLFLAWGLFFGLFLYRLISPSPVSQHPVNSRLG